MATARAIAGLWAFLLRLAWEGLKWVGRAVKAARMSI